MSVAKVVWDWVSLMAVVGVGLAGLGGFLIPLVTGPDMDPVQRAAATQAWIQLTVLVTVLAIAVRLAWKVARQAPAPGAIEKECKALGVCGVTLMEDVGSRYPVEPFLRSAQRSITLLGYSSMQAIIGVQALVDHANAKRKVVIVLPNPANETLMKQIANLAEEGGYFEDLAKVFTNLREGWKKVVDKRKRNFEVWLTDAIPMFSAIIIDDARGRVRYAAHSWPMTQRLLLEVEESGKLLPQYVSSVERLIERHSAVLLASEADFDLQISNAKAL